MGQFKKTNDEREEFPSKGEGLESRKPTLVTPRQSVSSEDLDRSEDLTDIESDSDERIEGDQVLGNLNKPYGETQRRTENPAKEGNV